MKKRSVRIATCAAILLSMTACEPIAGETQENIAKPTNEGLASSQPIVLKVLQHSGTLSDEEFQKLMVKPVEEKYPNITLELVRNGKGSAIEQLIMSGAVPDIIFTSAGTALTNLIQLEVPLDLSDKIRSEKLDSSQYDPHALDAIKLISGKEKMYALPFSINFSVLYYNKDIFDKFGIPYPKDSMTWEDTIELAKKMTRPTEDIMGFDSLTVERYGAQMSLPFINYDTNKAVFATDGWKRAFEVYKAFKTIPGNKSSTPLPLVDAFIKNRNLAMMVAYGAVVGSIEEQHNKGNPMNWDMVTVPQFKEAPGKSWEIDLHALAVSSKTKHKDEAFKVVSLLTANEEVQTAMTREGRLTSLKNKKVLDAFGSSLNTLKGKNMDAILKSSPAPSTPPSEYKEIAKRQIVPAFNKVIDQDMDINTALREAEELADKEITEKLKAAVIK
ncbi:ABC transporter substrate-binding protein [Paenibacillus sp. UNC451MF]|uniref:ABC transporter substrate-binding protein n=1 Tax=Paenibacillus sp. UNC451MF TaxID=1449063 RepID=UPI00048CC1B2|nr:extracellular solute-binding protein [Paenibacillus sp. UNC451MF]